MSDKIGVVLGPLRRNRCAFDDSRSAFDVGRRVSAKSGAMAGSGASRPFSGMRAWPSPGRFDRVLGRSRPHVGCIRHLCVVTSAKFGEDQWWPGFDVRGSSVGGKISASQWGAIWASRVLRTLRSLIGEAPEVRFRGRAGSRAETWAQFSPGSGPWTKIAAIRTDVRDNPGCGSSGLRGTELHIRARSAHFGTSFRIPDDPGSRRLGSARATPRSASSNNSRSCPLTISQSRCTLLLCSMSPHLHPSAG